MTVELSRAVMSLCSELPSDPEDHGHVVVESDDLRVVLAALSTPPADDVRECPSSDTTYEQGLFACRNCGENAAMHEFRPRGTVTGAEVVWEYAIKVPGMNGWPDRYTTAESETEQFNMRKRLAEYREFAPEAVLVRRRAHTEWEEIS